MNFQTALNQVINRTDLSAEAMRTVMQDLMSGRLSDAQIGGFLVALRMKGESIEEISAAAAVMRDFAVRVDVDSPALVDIVGTGGDGARTFNISTAASFVIAAAGGKVAKHNNRSISGISGSADVLEQAGVKLGLQPEHVATCIKQVGVGYMFAPAHHPATRYAAAPRRELATRSIFNLLGPLTNPAFVRRQLIGVYQTQWLDVFARVLQRLGSEHSMVVRAQDGLDEISHAAATDVVELKDGHITKFQITPQQFGIKPGNLSDLVVTSAAHSHELMLAVLEDQPGPARDIVLLNAGAAIYVAGLAPDLVQGVELARQAVATRAALKKLQELAALTNSLGA
ncbi:MAG: anthranilate phosphoribosyltransferase [Gammaproteobacteria bacterium]|nr:anthranilate phosphoribosyltransferase [Gammaproteobacteria bacterium]